MRKRYDVASRPIAMPFCGSWQRSASVPKNSGVRRTGGCNDSGERDDETELIGSGFGEIRKTSLDLLLGYISRRMTLECSGCGMQAFSM